MGGIRIESNGDPSTTRVIDVYTGEEIYNIISVQVNTGLEGIFATITVVPEEIDITILEKNVVRKEEKVPNEITKELD